MTCCSLGTLKRKTEHGFTAMELVVAMSVAAIISAIAVSNTSEVMESFDRFNARTWLIHDLRRTQALALTEGCRGIVSIASDGASYSIGCDYLEYQSSTTPVPDVAQMTRELPNGFSIEASAPIIFSSRGQAIDPYGVLSSVTVTLNDISGEPYANGTLYASGFFEVN